MDIQSTLVGYKQLVLVYLILVQSLQSIESTLAIFGATSRNHNAVLGDKA